MTPPDAHRAVSESNEPAIALSAITKSFSGQRVLDQVSFDVRAGETHVLAGENGAGKSTLMKILRGVHHADAGELRIHGQPMRVNSVRDASSHGIAMIHQELSLAPSMSVADNLFLGRERATTFGWVNRSAQRNAAREGLQRVGLAHVDPSRIVASLPLAVQQLVEIAKALLNHARILIMDEPTSALPKPDAERLFDLIDQLKSNPAQPAAIVYISHRMEEIYRLADRITVLRDGQHVITANANELLRDALVHAMVGRAVSEEPSREPHALGQELLRIDNLCVCGARGLAVRDASLALHQREIVGIAGLQGSGSGELLHALFGNARIASGSITIDGKPVTLRSPRDAMALGIALLTDDRKSTGLCQGLSIAANLTLPSINHLSPGGWRSITRERNAARNAISDFRIRCTGLRQPTSTLSGGNQQKVAIGKWLMRQPRILLLNDPTRGVDVGARQEIHRCIHDAAARNAAILFISSDLPELLALSDRIIVMHRGAITAQFGRAHATPERVMAAAMGAEANVATEATA